MPCNATWNPRIKSVYDSLHASGDILIKNRNVLFNKLRTTEYENHALIRKTNTTPCCSAVVSGFVWPPVEPTSTAASLGNALSTERITSCSETAPVSSPDVSTPLTPNYKDDNFSVSNCSTLRNFPTNVSSVAIELQTHVSNTSRELQVWLGQHPSPYVLQLRACLGKNIYLEDLCSICNRLSAPVTIEATT